jgi:hypothetical protein
LKYLTVFQPQIIALDFAELRNAKVAIFSHLAKLDGQNESNFIAYAQTAYYLF